MSLQTGQITPCPGVGNPLTPVFPSPIPLQRAPTGFDNANPGQIVLDQIDGANYILNGFSGGQAQWAPMGFVVNQVVGFGGEATSTSQFTSINAGALNIAADTTEVYELNNPLITVNSIVMASVSNAQNVLGQGYVGVVGITPKAGIAYITLMNFDPINATTGNVIINVWIIKS
jgi:hypothetical protein